MKEMSGKREGNAFILQLEEDLSKVKKPLLTLDEMILLLLYAQKDKPIITRTLLFKELFLFYEEILKKNIDINRMPNPKFIAYKYGPFSFTLSEVLASLVVGGLIENIGRAKGRDEMFKLTPAGIKMAEKVVNRMPPSIREKLMRELKEKRIGWDQLGRDGILNYVYKKYEKWKAKSKIKDKYKGVKWGVLFEE